MAAKSKLHKLLPDISYEKKLWNSGFKTVAGLDEVGRGSFAGPVVAGCVVFGKRITSRTSITGIKINDSKKLSEKQRENANLWIKENCLAWGIGTGSVSQINKFGIVKATEIAFRKAINDCQLAIDFLLIDAFYIPYVRGLRRRNQKAIVKGDTKSISIASASIIAKVYRDKLMASLGSESKFIKYKWADNKGYGTKDHRDAILKHGITRHHRKQFVSNLLTHH